MRNIHACVILCCVVLLCQNTQSAIDDVFRRLDKATAEATMQRKNTGKMTRQQAYTRSWYKYKMKGYRKTLVKIQHGMILERDTYDRVFSKSNNSEETFNSSLAQSFDRKKYKRGDDYHYRNISDSVFRRKRYAATEDKRWPNDIINYLIDKEFSKIISLD
ncbi:uncharacterized protein LOC127839910 [Dreissena polymorpha]|uniref:uncharacterized protein LOC127839910 n=1 Tax=Dreissena polymorpha TaxID=45954 RepID=UPI002263DF74|nr:uncharacterized protein LOC127839910 [Dreissena polymorpha]